MERMNAKGVALAIIGGTCWGFSGCCAQYLFEHNNLDNYWLTSVRLMSAGLLCILIVLSRSSYRKDLAELVSSKKHLLRTVLYGILGLALCQLSYLSGIKFTNAATETVIQYAGPAFVVVAVCLMQKRKPAFFELVALLCAIGGTFLIATHGDIHSLVISGEGLFWCVTSAIAVAVYTLMLGETGKRFPIIVCNAVAMPVGGIALALIFRIWTMEANIDLYGLFAMCGIVVVGTVVAFTFYLQAVVEIGAVNTSMLATSEPLSSAVISFFWLGTRFDTIDVVGFVLIISTVIWLTINDKQKAKNN